MDRYPLRALPTQSCRCGNREIHPRWIRIGYAVEQQCRLVREGDLLWPLAGLRPQHGLAVLSETVCRVMSNPIDTPGHTFQSSTLRQANQDRILYAGGARLFRREQTAGTENYFLAVMGRTATKTAIRQKQIW
jgi:hypothetical protein